MTLPIHQSLKKYYKNRSVFNAVNDLVEVLDGSKTPKLNMREVKNYNQALLMAAQSRADFVDLLFRVWDETFGKAEFVGKECFESQAYTISLIWESAELGVSYYYGTGDDDKRSNTLGVMQETNGENNTICLWVQRFSKCEKPTSEPDIPNGLGGWTIDYGEGDAWYFRNKPVDMVEFLDRPVPTIEQFRHDVIEMANFLKDTPA